jgi:tRNA (cmo5U34)-methyltransferase
VCLRAEVLRRDRERWMDSLRGMSRLQHWDPDTFLERMHETVPAYERLQQETVAATGSNATRILELGTGTGETARRVLARHPAAVLVGLDASDEILDRAHSVLPADRVELRVARFEDHLPDNPFDLVVSVLAVHHLDGAGKADLFQRIAVRLTPSGRFVIGDFVVPEQPLELVTKLDPEYDHPNTVADQLRWLTEAGLEARVAWAHGDLAVLVGDAPLHTWPPDRLRRRLQRCR